jgi:AcrR family transcriptional regulator
MPGTRQDVSVDWPLLPEVTDPRPPKERRSWGKVSHSERYKRQRRDLLRAAGRLAARDGYEKTRVADIVAEAGLSKSTFYEHFTSKDECFVDLYRRTSAQMLRGAVATAEATIHLGPHECILAVIRAFVGYSDRNPRLAEALRVSLGAMDSTVLEHSDENLRRVIHFFVALAHRLRSPLESDELELASTIMVRGVTDILGSLRSDPSTLDERLDQIARIGVRAFGFESS